MPGRAHHLVAVGIVATVAMGATAGVAPAPAGGEESSASPLVARVAGELARSGARSVLVFISDEGKECVATAARRPASAISCSRTTALGAALHSAWIGLR